MAETDPKTVQDLTSVVQTLLQQMQDKFQTMSDQIIGRNILCICNQPLWACGSCFPGWGGRAGRRKQGACHTEELKVANLHRNLEHCFRSQEKTKWLFAANFYV
ncbi:Heat shock factor-binding protein 1 [Manis javanica]|nr:Heat shock factor-binding protein 1 [Manis javanica]